MILNNLDKAVLVSKKAWLARVLEQGDLEVLIYNGNLDVAEVMALCRREGWHVPISNQPLYNLFRRDIEAAVVPTSVREGLGQLVYSPLAQGVLTGKYKPGEAPPAGTRATEATGSKFVSRYMSDAHLERTQRLVQLGKKHGLDSTQIALAFCLRNPGVSSVLIGARDTRQLAQNLTAVDVELPTELVAEVEELFPIVMPTVGGLLS